ncbi:MAG: RnfH family protein [Zoogloeaceae bacterium]|jgi:putative ubiquitin-RnfH superfamily antitoxin RatB of RatAB toxin-antitoxin module|nr:RnfH family protein [Zoogloeaceae bacterium]
MNAEVSEEIGVEVVYALPEKQARIQLRLPAGSNVETAVQASGLLRAYPEIDLKTHKIGIFAKLTKLDALLRDRDRVEIYRPLVADPKEVRKRRSAEGKGMKAGNASIPGTGA